MLMQREVTDRLWHDLVNWTSGYNEVNEPNLWKSNKFQTFFFFHFYFRFIRGLLNWQEIFTPMKLLLWVAGLNLGVQENRRYTQREPIVIIPVYDEWNVYSVIPKNGYSHQNIKQIKSLINISLIKFHRVSFDLLLPLWDPVVYSKMPKLQAIPSWQHCNKEMRAWWVHMP